MRLHVNKIGIVNDYIRILTKELSLATDSFKADMLREQGNLGKKYGTAEVEMRKMQDRIVFLLKVNRAFLADNYGTGSLMDINNPGFSEYLASGLWNPYRTGLSIVSRGAGQRYVNFAGKTIIPKGRGGIPLEYRRFKQPRGGWIEIRPIRPSHAYEWAQQWFEKSYLPRAINNTLRTLNISKHLIFK